MRESLERVEISDDLLDYVIAIVTATRKDPQIQVGASPRGGLALVQLARGQALLHQRDYVVPDDIKQVAVPALAHRITLRPELWVRQVSADDVVARLLAAVATPRTDPTVRVRRGRCPGRRRRRVIKIADIERTPASLATARRTASSPDQPRTVVPGAGGRGRRQVAAVAACPPPADAGGGRAAAGGGLPPPRAGRPRRARAAAARRGPRDPRRPPRTAHGPGRPHLDPHLRGRAGRRRRRRVRDRRDCRRDRVQSASPGPPAVEGASGVGFDARWALEPGRGIEPGSATAVNGAAARFTFTIDALGQAEARQRHPHPP